MFDKLRIPFFCASIVCLIIVFAIEVSAQFFLGDSKGKGDLSAPGLGIIYLAWLDWLLLFSILLMGVALIVPDRIHGRIQGIITFIVALLTLLGAIVAIFTAFGLLMLMVSLLLAVPIGTAIYFAEFADFKVGAAAATLTLIMIFKGAFVIFLVLAHQRFLQNKGLVLLIATSFVATILLGFLHAIAPPFLAYITDDIGALISAILAAIWALFFLIGSIPAVIKALRVDRALKS
ncbi:hypothetical protein SAMN05421690_102929 [Nitrosomonas sp. Nm51]|uniref:hypothetical protein n=1 Tax=Nitrosomonas sp. Nm51 TaxID=133720 RepID=UPI0008D8ADAB|nr:hypothetical protein [Nitrosomonas sp. Nm51]SER47321.1 hypothetical protein SAMN05421690_102929 [Nitrosomonas sp. Nm51]